jgi:hypothetical protein
VAGTLAAAPELRKETVGTGADEEKDGGRKRESDGLLLPRAHRVAHVVCAPSDANTRAQKEALRKILLLIK